MARSTSSEYSVSSFENESIENKYCQLLDAFQEPHGEARKLQYANNKLKSENKWLEGRIEGLNKENNNMKSKLESLENTPKENMRRNKRSVYECENYSNQMERVKCFMNTLFKFTLGSSNLDGLLGSQRSVLNKQ